MTIRAIWGPFHVHRENAGPIFAQGFTSYVFLVVLPFTKRRVSFQVQFLVLDPE